MAQHRLTETISRISAIEMNSIKDSVLASKKKKETEAAYQRSKMKQQKGLCYVLIFFFFLQFLIYIS